MPDYTIRYLRSDGAVSMYYRPSCFSDSDAARQAASQMRPEFAQAEVWRDLDCFAILTARLPACRNASENCPPKAA